MNLLVPIAYIQEVCLLSDNIDQKKILVALDMAQEDLEDILLGEFYEEIETQYLAGTLTSDNNSLYDPYIKKFLAWQTNYHYLGHSQSSSTPTGEREFTDENSTLINDVSLFAKEKKLLARANKQKYKLINFLKLEQSKDSTKYPLWEDDCKEYMSFAITSVDKKSDALIKVNKSITTNE